MKNRIFAGIVLAILILPNLLFFALRGCIDTTNRENRAYAEFPELSISNYKNISFELEAYYTDRLPFKNQLKQVSASLDRLWKKGESNYETYYAMDSVTEGRDGWLFYTVTQADENSVTELFGRNLYSEEKLHDIEEQVIHAGDFFEERHSQLVLLYPPSKEFVYSDYLPENIQSTMTDYPRCEQLADDLGERTDTIVLYPKNALKEGRNVADTYYKYDSHWNAIGAFYALQDVLQAIGKDTKELTPDMIYPSADGYPTDLLGLLGTKESTPDTYYWIEYRPEVSIEMMDCINNDYVIYSSTSEDKRSVLVLGDSFSWDFASLLAADFSSVMVATDEEKAAEFYVNAHPDIVIVETAQRKYDTQETILLKLEEAVRLLEKQ